MAETRTRRGGRGRKRPGALEPEPVKVSDLKPHPRNYRKHPEDQLQHIAQSIREHGFYRPVVTAEDLTILAGHGVVEAVRKHLTQVRTLPVVRLPVKPDSPAALKVIAGDNEMGALAEVDDRLLTELLREVREADDLLGTGYDEQQLALLLMATRPASEIADLDEAAEWIGLPGFDEPGDPSLKCVVKFRTEEDRAKFMELIGSPEIVKKVETSWTMWYPSKPKEPLVDQRWAVPEEVEA